MKKTTLLSVLAAIAAAIVALVGIIMYIKDYKSLEGEALDMVLPFVSALLLFIIPLASKKNVLMVVPVLATFVGYLTLDLNELVIGSYETISFMALIVYVVAVILASVKGCKYCKIYVISYTAILAATTYVEVADSIASYPEYAYITGSYFLSLVAIVAYYCSFEKNECCCNSKEEVKEESKPVEEVKAEEVVAAVEEPKTEEVVATVEESKAEETPEVNQE